MLNISVDSVKGVRIRGVSSYVMDDGDERKNKTIFADPKYVILDIICYTYFHHNETIGGFLRYGKDLDVM